MPGDVTTPAPPSHVKSDVPSTGGTDFIASPGKGLHALILPLNRVKTLIKEDSEVKAVSTEACYAVAKATELLLQLTAQKAGLVIKQEGNSGPKPELQYDHVAEVVADWGALNDFLEDIIPKRITAREALERMQQR